MVKSVLVAGASRGTGRETCLPAADDGRDVAVNDTANLSSAVARTGGVNAFIDDAASKGAVDVITTGLARDAVARSPDPCRRRP